MRLVLELFQRVLVMHLRRTDQVVQQFNSFIAVFDVVIHEFPRCFLPVFVWLDLKVFR
jgi:hypothetical protein